MAVETHTIQVKTHGNSQVLDLTPMVEASLSEGQIRNGTVTVFVVGSTAAISTTEYEPGLVNKDLGECFEKLAPEDGTYLHEETWHDDNGHSHVRATLVGPSITVPLIEGTMTLGTWQQIILLDFDTRTRQREVIVQVVGDSNSHG